MVTLIVAVLLIVGFVVLAVLNGETKADTEKDIIKQMNRYHYILAGATICSYVVAFQIIKFAIKAFLKVVGM